MKKVLFAVALLFGAFTASAQVSVVKEAKGLKGKPEQAAKVLEAALTNPETANDPETWKLAGDFQKAIYDAENEKMYLSAVDKTKVADLLVRPSRFRNWNRRNNVRGCYNSLFFYRIIFIRSSAVVRSK